MTATEEIREAWERMVRRSVDLGATVTGEARVRQSLADAVGVPALVALEAQLARGIAGWTRDGSIYRFEVEGGFLVYDAEERSLEIVASAFDEIRVTGEAQSTLQGVLEEAVTVEGESRYYDDNWGGRTEADAERDAATEAQRKLEEARRERLLEAQDIAEAEAAEAVQTAARLDAERKLAEQAEVRREQLARQAATHLESVGLRCRQEFHRVLGVAYREAILAYARANGADGVRCTEDNEVVEIEFFVDN